MELIIVDGYKNYMLFIYIIHEKLYVVYMHKLYVPFCPNIYIAYILHVVSNMLLILSLINTHIGIKILDTIHSYFLCTLNNNNLCHHHI